MKLRNLHRSIIILVETFGDFETEAVHRLLETCALNEVHTLLQVACRQVVGTACIGIHLVEL